MIAQETQEPGWGRDFLRVSDRAGPQLVALLARARELRETFLTGQSHRSLAGRRIALVWDERGFRTRVAFELGISLMGGTGIEVPGPLGEAEGAVDVAGYLDRWFDAIVSRTPRFDDLTALAEGAGIPVVNARTRHNHPCEILGDLAYINATRTTLEDLHVVFIGETSNLCRSWCEAASVLPIRLTQVCPPGHEVDLGWFAALSPSPAGTVESTHALDGLEGADVIYTDRWPSSTDGEERRVIFAEFSPLQVTADVLERVKDDALFMPCPPVMRGQEVSDEAMTSPKCRVPEAKEWLLHAQSALLEEILRGELR